MAVLSVRSAAGLYPMIHLPEHLRPRVGDPPVAACSAAALICATTRRARGAGQPAPSTPPPAASERRRRRRAAPADGNEMRLAVENVTGRFRYVEVEAEEGKDDATVGRLKSAVAGAEAVPEQRVILVTQGDRVMADDSAPLGQYDVHEGSVVYVYFVPDGSTKWASSYDYLRVGGENGGGGGGGGGQGGEAAAV